MKRFTLVAGVLAMTLSGGCGAEDELFLRPNSVVRRTPADLNYAYDEVILPDGEDHVAIWHVHTPGPRKGIVVSVPGAADNKSRYVVGLPIFVDQGWDMILMDYAGFGDSTGPATLERAVHSARVVFDYAQSQDPVVIGSGLSFGTAVLARVAADYDLKAVVFDGTLNLWESMSLYADQNDVRAGSGFMGLMDAVIRMATPEDYDTKRWIAQVAEPKLFIHSPDDEVTPLQGAWEVFEAAPQPKFFFTVQGEHVTEVLSNPEVYRSVVTGWLDGVVGTGPKYSDDYHELLERELDSYLTDLTLVVPLIEP